MTYQYSDTDTEAANEHTPMLPQDNAGNKKNSRRSFFRFLDVFAGGIYAPDASTYDPIEILLNTEDLRERDRLTEKWRDNRLSELSFIGVVVCIQFSKYISRDQTER
jgi:hypothetical protein